MKLVGVAGNVVDEFELSGGEVGNDVVDVLLQLVVDRTVDDNVVFVDVA